MYQIEGHGDKDGIDWYAKDNRQLALPFPTRPLLATKEERK